MKRVAVLVFTTFTARTQLPTILYNIHSIITSYCALPCTCFVRDHHVDLLSTDIAFRLAGRIWLAKNEKTLNAPNL